MQFIYHIHTKYCHHASNTIKGIVDLALKEGYKTLYITEHCPLDNNNYLHFRTTRQGIVSLKKEIDQANKKNKNKLTIYFGYEIEYNKVNKKYFDSFKKDDYVNFLIFGNHYVGDM
jgi:histidinol-phosphatase (PHP family)